MSAMHILAHDMMVRYLVKQMRRRFAKEVKAENRNIPPSPQAKPDIEFTLGSTKHYIDVGFSNDAEAYYNAKMEKYRSNGNKNVHPIIFQKDCSILPESLEFLKSLPEIKIDALYEKFGSLLAYHFSACKRASQEIYLAQIPADSLISKIHHSVACNSSSSY